LTAQKCRRRKRRRPNDTITYQDLSIRDELLLKLITGATKAGVEEDEKKRENKRRARRRVSPEEDG
jgi:hypothetical protein